MVVGEPRDPPATAVAGGEFGPESGLLLPEIPQSVNGRE